MAQAIGSVVRAGKNRVSLARGDSIEQGRRLYARQHYLSDLYYAHEWQQIFEMLNAGEYGHMKVQADLSTHFLCTGPGFRAKSG